MKTFLLHVDLRNLTKFGFFLILLLYPFFSYIVYEGTGIVPNYLFGFICFSILIIRLNAIYQTGGILVLPTYIIIFGIFTAYVILSNIFVSDLFLEKGAVKYFYSSPFLMTFVVFLYIENTCFPPKWLNLGIRVLGLTLIFSAIVSIIQVHDPLFLRKSDLFIQDLSLDRLAEYYSNNDNPMDATGVTSRMLQGYRLSIYSYMDALSVGIDGMAIFSLLIALKSKNWIRNVLLIVVAALVSFLSSARWIMLNFLIIASHGIWLTQHKVFNLFKYIFFGVALLLLLMPVLKSTGVDIQRFTEERLTDNSASTRLLAFEVFFKVFPDSPILGTGGVETPEVKQLLQGRSSQIHVGYLKLFYYYGLIGGLLYLAFLFSLLNRMWKTARHSGYWGGFFAILAFAVANLTLVQLGLFYYGLLLAIIYSNYFIIPWMKVLTSFQVLKSISR